MTPPLSEADGDVTEQAVDDSLLVEPGVLTVALDTSDAPQVLTGTDGSYEGYSIDVAAALAENMGLELAIVHAATPDEALSSGEADIFLGATSRNQKEDIVVSGEYLQNATALFGAGSSTADHITADDLSGALIGVQEGSASQEALARLGLVASSTYGNVNECFEALAKGEITYVACDATAGAYLSMTYEDMFFAGTISASTSYGIAYPSASTDLATEVNAALEEITTDGTLDAIHTMWYGDMPLNLSSELISGVTLPEEPEEDAKEEEESDINDF